MDTLYNNQVTNTQNYDPSNDVSDKIISEWCQDSLPIFQETAIPDNPETIGATRAMTWIPGYQKKDMRPRILEKKTNKHYLVDSGSASLSSPPVLMTSWTLFFISKQSMAKESNAAVRKKLLFNWEEKPSILKLSLPRSNPEF